MEDFNLKGLDSVQLNEIYFKVKKLMEIKRDEFYQLDMKLGCLVATIDSELSRTQSITVEEQTDIIKRHILKPSPLPPVETPVENPEVIEQTSTTYSLPYSSHFFSSSSQAVKVYHRSLNYSPNCFQILCCIRLRLLSRTLNQLFHDVMLPTLTYDLSL